MVGRDLQTFEYKNLAKTDLVLSVKGFSGARFKDISFDLHKAEILGMAGLVGAGRSEAAQAIFGVTRNEKGNLKLGNREVRIRNSTDAIKQGIGYLPENRKEQGLFLEMSVAENILSVKANNDRKSIFLNHKKFNSITNEFINKLEIKTPSSQTKVINLSGGNQQKIVLAKWLTLNPKILIIDEPTAGIDVGAKSEIYRLLNELTETGTSIILISSDLQELLGICDRILVFCNGRITADLPRDQFSEEEIMHYSSGIKDMFK
jgi:ABC-type sugar transport system ATPase subunit